MKPDPYVDLHIHSYYSDGTLSPAEILETAAQNGVGCLAVSDHNELAGARELARLTRDSGAVCIAGVELDGLFLGRDIHILGYGFDLEDPEFEQFAQRNAGYLEQANLEFIQRMEADFPMLSLEGYHAYHHDRRQGGWKALHYIIDSGAARSPEQAYGFYQQYGFSYDGVPFPTADQVCAQIHRAGGKAVLAHPGKALRFGGMEELAEQIAQLARMGIDGVECYYPSHSPEVTQSCLEACRRLDLLVTTGSDCHGSYEQTQIGQTRRTRDQLRLGPLLPGDYRE